VDYRLAQPGEGQLLSQLLSQLLGFGKSQGQNVSGFEENNRQNGADI